MLKGWWPSYRSWPVVAIAFALFAGLLIAVLVAGKGPVGPDLVITSGMNQWALDSGSYPFWQAITHLGEAPYLLPVYLVILVATLVVRRWSAAVFVVIAGWYPLVSWLAKIAVSRPRPPIEHPYNLKTFESFPSGHAGAAAALAALAFVVVAMSLTGWWRVVTTALCIAVPVLVGLSRLALGVHYPSDVLGAMGLAVLWVLGSAYAVAYGRAMRERHVERQYAPAR